MWHVVRGRGARTPDPGTLRSRARAAFPRVCAGALMMAILLGLTTASQRPFEHRRHENVSCTQCHGAADTHGTVSVRSALDCAACHHDARRNLECSRCHDPRSLPEDRTVTQVLVLSAPDSVRQQRALPFGHGLHADAACRDCHETPVTLAMTRTCASCHDQHHHAEASCRACHGAEVQAVHRVDAHLSCAGGGCHSAPLPPLNASRMLCLACHPAQADHEPADSCALCHQVPGLGARS